jgi:hypothetical protein
MNLNAIVSILSVFIGAPAIVFSFVYFSKKQKLRLEEMKIKRDILELELEKDKMHLRLLDAENDKYDRLIEGEGR